MCKTRWVECHTCYDTCYDMYEFLCECLEAVLLNPFGYHDIYEEVAWTGSWRQDEGSRAANQFHFVAYHHLIHHHQECFGECQAHGLQASKEGFRHIPSVQYDPPNTGTNDNDETGNRRGVQCVVLRRLHSCWKLRGRFIYQF